MESGLRGQRATPAAAGRFHLEDVAAWGVASTVAPMRIEIRQDDSIRPNDDVVLRAGGGSIDNLVARALENAEYYEPLMEAGQLPSPWTISVHVPREGLAGRDDLLGGPPYSHYNPFLEADAQVLLATGCVLIIPTTITMEGEEPSAVDLCHFDLVLLAVDENQLYERITKIRQAFRKEQNPYRHR